MAISDTAVEDIEKDLHRQFPFHEMFCERGGTGQQDLKDVLHAYVAYNPEDGYCQGQAPVAAVLLMHMPAKVEENMLCFRGVHLLIGPLEKEMLFLFGSFFFFLSKFFCPGTFLQCLGS